MCVVAGCDYCESLAGIGIKTARNIVSECFQNSYKYYTREESKIQLSSSEPPLVALFKRLFRSKAGRRLTNDEQADYKERFMGALLMYRHPVVYCPISKKCLYMNDPANSIDADLMAYPPYAQLCSNKEKLANILGDIFDQNKTKLVIEGWMNPKLETLYNEKNIPTSIMKIFHNYCRYNNATIESKPMDSQPELSSKSSVLNLKKRGDNTTASFKIIKFPNQELRTNTIIQPTNSQSTGQDSSSSSRIQTQESSTQESSELLSSPDFFENKMSPQRKKYNTFK